MRTNMLHSMYHAVSKHRGSAYLAGFLLMAILFIPACAHWQGDRIWWQNDPECQCSKREYKAVTLSSRYITMRDGVKIAVDVYLPEGLKAGEHVPTILMQTRYVRRMQFRWPFNHLVKGRFHKLIQEVVRHGYAWVYVDARGSGASFGTRPHPYSKEETQDGYEIVDWITEQTWSDGSVGAFGNSYTGGSALFLATTGHPAVKAVMPRYAMFDVYPEVLFPGGLHLSWLSDVWGRLAKAIDKNRAEEFVGPKATLAIIGTSPVDDDKNHQQLEKAVEEHAHNGDITTIADGIVYRDDESAHAPGLTVDTISPHTRLAQLNQPGLPYYFYTGWFDASFVRSEIHLFMNIDDPQKKLTIGPWDHGNYTNISPYARKRKPLFKESREILRFFDHYLKGLETGITEEKAVHYFTMGEERWKSADTWPPPEAKPTAFYLRANNTLSQNPPEESGFDKYTVDPSAATGSRSRWVSLVNLDHKPIQYPHRKKADAKLLCYTSDILQTDMEVTGHPIVKLIMASSADDASVFVYLEDIDEKGRVHYVTEGMLRALHRKLSEAPPPYRTPVPYRSFLRKDGEPLVPGEKSELIFDLYPTSYLFKQGHRIRISIAGADVDHFAPILPEPPDLTFYREPDHASHVLLPLILKR